MNATFDAKNIHDKTTFHRRFKHALRFQNYYGHNLDALYDLFMEIQSDLTLVIVNTESLSNNLGAYGESIVDLLKTVNLQKANITIKFN